MIEQVPAITIGIPFYSHVEYLRRALDSVRAQTRTDWVCIVIDDAGPCPESAKLIEYYNDPRIAYIRASENGGLAVNWNRCLDAARTDFVMLMHADDELKADYLERMFEIIGSDDQAEGYFCGAEIINEGSEKCFSFADYIKTWLRPKDRFNFRLTGDVGLASILRGNFIMCPTLIYNMPKIQNIRFTTRWKMVLDVDFYANILISGGYFVGTNREWYRYRRHSQNQTSLLTNNSIRFTEEVEIYDDLAETTQRIGWWKSAKIAERKAIIKLNLTYQVLVALVQMRFADSRKFCRILLERFKL